MSYDPLGLDPDPGKPIPLDFNANREAAFISRQLTDFADGSGGHTDATFAELAELVWKPNRPGIDPSAVTFARNRLEASADGGSATAARLLRELEDDLAALPEASGNVVVQVGRIGTPITRAEGRLTNDDDPFGF